MKSLLSMVFEAGIPSKIIKKKTNIIKKTNQYKFGDTNDTVSGTYNQEDEYFKNNSQGYIIDRKTGTKHDVVDASYNSDSGAIAGGTINWVLYISNVGPIKKLKVSGYQGIMSSPSTITAKYIISHISDGYYLEDYLAIHKRDIAKGDRDKISDIISNGNVDAKSYKDNKESRMQEKKVKFFQNYGCLSRSFGHVGFNVTNDGTVKLYQNTLLAHNSLKSKESDSYNARYVDNPNSKSVAETATKTAAENVAELLKQEINPDLKELKGISGIVAFKKKVDSGELEDITYEQIFYNIKSKKFVMLNNLGEYDLMGNTTRFNPKESAVEVVPYIQKLNIPTDSSTSEFAKDLKLKAVKEWDKSRKKGRKEYIDANYRKFLNAFNGVQTKGKAQSKARDEYDEETESKKKGYLPFEFYAQFCKGGKVVGTDKDKIEKDKDKAAVKTKTIKGGQEKMDAWHNGTRKQNVKNCSDDKLKAYYKICVDSGYDEEAEKLRSEADSRGLKLNESISLSTYAELF